MRALPEPDNQDHETIERQTFRLLLDDASKGLEELRAANAPGVASYVVDIAEACQKQDKRILAAVANRIQSHVALVRSVEKDNAAKKRDAIIGNVVGSITFVAVICFFGYFMFFAGR
jgi:predicted GTPase